MVLGGLRALLESSSGVWGALEVHLGGLGALLGASWGGLGRSWDALGAPLGRSWAVLGRPWGGLGRS